MKRSFPTRLVSRQRGFVLIIVVMLLAVLGVAVAVQLDTARGQSIDASRTREDAAARAVAETCLDLLLAQTRGYLSSSTPPPPDFDALLDPDGDPDSGDEFLPPISGLAGVDSAVVAVPKGSARPSSRYRLYRFSADGAACLARYDDNSDDAVPSPLLPPSATGNTNGVAEGPSADQGRDVLARDRDRAIQLTAIGVFPVPAGVLDGDVYDRAHARVTLRRVIETSGGPAVWAGDAIITAQNNAVCGLGGLTADDLQQGNTGAICACGEQNLGTTTTVATACDYTSASKPGSMCDDESRACEPRILGAVKRQIDPWDPSPAIDSPIEELMKDTGGDPDPEIDPAAWLSTSTIGNPGTNGVCEFYVRQRRATDPADAAGRDYGATYFADNANLAAEVYVWNHQADGLLTVFVAGMGLTALTCEDTGGAVVPCPTTCSNFTGATLPRPCDFSVSGTSLTATCAADESPCWQLVAQLDGAADRPLGTPPGVVAAALAAANLLGEANTVGLREQTTVIAGAETWAPMGTPVGAGALTAAVVSLANGAGMTQLTTWDRLCNGGTTWTTTDVVSVSSSGNITKHANWQRRSQFAARSIWLYENPPDREVLFPSTPFGTVAGEENLPVQLLIAATGDVHFDGPLGLCCPTCNCPNSPTATTPVPPSMPVQGGSTSDGNSRTHGCDGTDGTTAIMNPPAPLTTQPIKSRLAVRAGGHCLFEQSSSVIGDIMCKTVHIKGGGCFVADVFGHGACPGGRCVDSRFCTAGTCPPGHAHNELDRGAGDSGCDGPIDPAGCEAPGVCINNPAGRATSIIGATFSRGDVCVLDPLTTWGQVIAAENVRFGPEVVVNHDGTTGGGVGAIVNTVAWFEASR